MPPFPAGKYRNAAEPDSSLPHKSIIMPYDNSGMRRQHSNKNVFVRKSTPRNSGTSNSLASTLFLWNIIISDPQKNTRALTKKERFRQSDEIRLIIRFSFWSFLYKNQTERRGRAELYQTTKKSLPAASSFCIFAIITYWRW